MNPEEKVLLERTLKLTEENNRILHRLDRARRARFVWGFIKVLIIILPLIAGYIYLEPMLTPVIEQYKDLLHI